MQITKDQILCLLEKHSRCVTNLFVASTLPCIQSQASEGVVLSDQKDPLSDYSQLESFVREVYVSEEAERLLNGAKHIYENVDGKTAVILDHVQYLPVFVDWAHPEVLSITESENQATILVSLLALEIMDGTEQEKFEISMEAAYENGTWKLKKCYH